MYLEIVFWTLIALMLYSYFGYVALLYFGSLFKIKQKTEVSDYQPNVTILVAAYNEIDIIDAKITNSLLIDYPKDKITFLWVTDGSNDGSYEHLQKNNHVKVLHQNERNGKIGAINRAMQHVTTPIVIFCDANTMLSANCVKEITSLFADPLTGCVAGEKQIITTKLGKAVNSGEGFYWQYESYIKKLESEVNSVVGAAGELFAIRTELFQPVEADTLLDDFVISLRIVEKGFKIRYAPNAIAVEHSSATIKEELKRKVRIAAGGIQTLFRMISLLNPFKNGMLTFQYISHKVLRWTIIPISFPVLLILNILLYKQTEMPLYKTLLILQVIFYLFVVLGLLLKNKEIKYRFIFIPYYLITMNVAVLLGIIRYFRKKQTVNWDKAKRLQ